MHTINVLLTVYAKTGPSPYCPAIQHRLAFIFALILLPWNKDVVFKKVVSTSGKYLVVLPPSNDYIIQFSEKYN